MKKSPFCCFPKKSVRSDALTIYVRYEGAQKKVKSPTAISEEAKQFAKVIPQSCYQMCANKCLCFWFLFVYRHNGSISCRRCSQGSPRTKVGSSKIGSKNWAKLQMAIADKHSNGFSEWNERISCPKIEMPLNGPYILLSYGIIGKVQLFSIISIWISKCKW